MRGIDLKGKKFGRLLVIKLLPERRSRSLVWQCLCDCGEIRSVIGDYIRKGGTKSCGCLCREMARKRATKHGMSGTPLYAVWKDMRTRCYNPDAHAFKDYGARGITVCDRWKDSFLNFIADMGERPKGYTLERIDNDGNYIAKNCTWASRAQQARNRRNTKLSEEKVAHIRRLSKGALSQARIARMFGVRRTTVCRILTGKRWKGV
ncbi:hypothetical protein KAR91_31760 [Candidatus Pacearchaeota archaeon]|nr:hypothetical protein [Candidatus Pacearchaeota archaeon]